MRAGGGYAMRFLLIVLLSLPVYADTLTWDHPGAEGYRVYQDGAQIQDVTEKTAEVTVPQSGATYTVTAYKGAIESAHSAPLTIPQSPSAVTVTITYGGP